MNIPAEPLDIGIDPNDITGAIAVEQLGRIANKRFHDWPKYVTLALAVLTLVVGAAIWATSAHAAIRDWTAEQDFVTKEELRNVMKEQYVPLHEFTKVQQSLDNQTKNLEKLDIKLDKVLDQLHYK